MIKKISKKIKKLLPCISKGKKNQDKQFIIERRKGDRRSGTDRRWMSKLLNGDNLINGRRTGERRIGDRRKI